LRNLEVSAGKIQMSNPVIIASGVVAVNGDGLEDAMRYEPGAVVTKSTGVKGNQGYLTPNIAVVRYGIINSMGLPNPGADEFRSCLEGMERRCPVICSLYGSSPDEYIQSMEILDGVCDGFELNFSCPHARRGHGGLNVASDPSLVREIVDGVCGATDLPVWVKLPFHHELPGLADISLSHGASALTLINTLPAMDIDIYSRSPVLHNVYGGLSGPCIFPVALRCVHLIYREYGADIIGCGGVSSGEDIIKMMMAGARAVEVGTVMFRRGPRVVQDLKRELQDLLEQLDADIDDILGAAHG